MAKHYDATAKELLEADPAGWVRFLGLRAGGPVSLTDTDLATVTAAADKVIRVDGPAPFLLHVEFQARRDPDLPRRLLWYNVLIGQRHAAPVRSVAVLMRRKADARPIDGHLALTLPDGGAYLEFRYLVVRVWQQPVEALLEGPLGALPLAPIGDVERARLPEVVRRVAERVGAEAEPAEASRLLAATQILCGMRLPEPEVDNLFREVFDMGGIHGIEEASSVVRAWIKRGKIEGRAEGLAEGRAEGRAETLADLLDDARQLLVRVGSILFGPPGPEVLRALGRIRSYDRIRALTERLPAVKSWDELLAKPGKARP